MIIGYLMLIMGVSMFGILRNVQVRPAFKRLGYFAAISAAVIGLYLIIFGTEFMGDIRKMFQD